MSGFFLLLVVFVLSQATAHTISQNIEIEPLVVFTNESSRSGKYYERLPANCFEATYTTQRTGIYVIQPFTQEPFTAYCDADTRGGGWTVIQRRKDGSVDFFRNWNAYKEGFGSATGEFWIGLDKLHALTLSSQQELLVVMEDFSSKTIYAMYDSFAIGTEGQGYYLKNLGRFSGDAGDALDYHKGHKFATRDKDTASSCATKFSGAWWYNNCHKSNLNGRYYRGVNQAGHAYTVWRTFDDMGSLKYVAVMVRPKLA